MRFFSVAAVVVGVLILTQGVVGLVIPMAFFGFVSVIQKPPVIYAATVVRILIGLVLIRASTGSRMPRLLSAFGILVTLGGLLTPLLGVRFAESVLGWWSQGGAIVIRSWAAASLALGVFVLYSLWPQESRAD